MFCLLKSYLVCYDGNRLHFLICSNLSVVRFVASDPECVSRSQILRAHIGKSRGLVPLKGERVAGVGMAPQQMCPPGPA